MGDEYDAFAEAAKLADKQIDTLRQALKSIAEEEAAQRRAEDEKGLEHHCHQR